MIKQTLTVCALLLLTSCGFHPVYGVNKHTPIGVETIMQSITINNIPDRDGQFLRNELIDRLHRKKTNNIKKLYSLHIATVNVSTKDLDITKDADSTRAQLQSTLNMQLRDSRTQDIILDRELKSIASYNTLSSEFTNRISERNTRENTLIDLARQIEQQITLYFKRNP